MIYCYTGTPGSGKSYAATELIYHKIYRPRPKLVIANYALNLDDRHKDNFIHVSNSDLTPEFLAEKSNEYFSKHDFHESEIILVLDEAQLVFNSRNWADKSRMGFLEFMSQSRHLGYDVILIAQSVDMIDKQFRALIEYEVKHRKLANFGLVGKVLNLLALGRIYAAVTYYFGLKEHLGVRFFRTRKKIFRLYDSYVMFRRNDEQ